MSNAILSVSGAHKTYQMGRSSLHVLRGASLSIQRGEFLAIMGASGSGKSTLLHVMGALDVPDRGQVHFEGMDLFARTNRSRDNLRNIHFGFVFQFYHLLPELTALENVLLPAMVRYSVLGWLRNGTDARARASNLLEEMNLQDRLRHRPNELSGGEMQRVAVARALINQPPVLLADEPTGNLDSKTGEGILSLLKALNEKGQTIVMVTHDARVAAAAHRTVHLADGRIKTVGE